MKIKILLLAFLLPFFVSCHHEDSEIIKGITETSITGTIGQVDSDDWNLDDQFTDREKKLFDTIDFTKKGIAEPMPSDSGILTQSNCIFFFPNPFHDFSYLLYYHNKHILNIVVVNNKYNILYSYRVENCQHLAFTFENLNKGIYRMYYAIQDKNYNVVHCGHGDIKKE